MILKTISRNMETSSNTNEVMEHDSVSPFPNVIEIKKEIADDDPIMINKVDDFDFEPFHETIFRTLSTNFDNEKNIGEVNNAFANLESCFLENNILNKNGLSKFSLKTLNNSGIFLKYRDIDDAFIDLGITDSNIKRTVLNKNLKKMDLKPFNETYFSIDDNENTFSDNDYCSKNGSDSDVKEDGDSSIGESDSDEISGYDESFESELVDDNSTVCSKEAPQSVAADINNSYTLRNGKSLDKISTQCENNDDVKVDSCTENTSSDNVRDIRVVVEKLPSESSDISHDAQENESFSLKSKSSLESRRQVARKKTGGMVINPDINRDSSCNKEQKIISQLSSKEADFVPNVFDKMTRAGKRDLERVLAESTANLVIQKTTQLISEKIRELQTQENELDDSSSSEDEAKESDIHKTAEIVTNTIIEFLTKSKSKKLDKLGKEITDEITNKINNLKSDTDCDLQTRTLSDSTRQGSPVISSVENCTNKEVRETRGNTQKKKSTEKRKMPSAHKMSADSLAELARIEKEIINYMEDASQSVEKENEEEYEEPPRRPQTRQSSLIEKEKTNYMEDLPQSVEKDIEEKYEEPPRRPQTRLSLIEKEKNNYVEDASQSVEKDIEEEYEEPPRRPQTRQSLLKQQQMLKNGSDKVNPPIELRKRSQRTCVKRNLANKCLEKHVIKAASPDSISDDSLINSSSHLDSQLKENLADEITNTNECKSVSSGGDNEEAVSSNENLVNISSSPNSKTLKANADSTTPESALPILESETFENINSKEQLHISEQNVDSGKETEIAVHSVTSNYHENESDNINNSISQKTGINFNEANTNEIEESQSSQKSEIGQFKTALLDESDLIESSNSNEQGIKLGRSLSTNSTCEVVEHKTSGPQDTCINHIKNTSKTNLAEEKYLDAEGSICKSKKIETQFECSENSEVELERKTDFSICSRDKEVTHETNNGLIPPQNKNRGIKDVCNEQSSSVSDTFPETTNVDISENATSFLNYTLDDSFRLTIDEGTPISEKVEICPKSLKKNDSKNVKMGSEKDREASNNISITDKESECNKQKNLEEYAEEVRSSDSKSDVIVEGTKERNNEQKSSNSNATKKSLLKSNKEDREENSFSSDQKNVNIKPLTNEEKIAQLTKRDPRLVPHEKKVVNALMRDPRIRNKLPKKEEIQEKPHSLVADSPLSPDSTPDSGKSSGQNLKMEKCDVEKCESTKKKDDSISNVQNSSKSELSEPTDSRKKKFKKAVDEELLYKTPLSDLHDSSGDRPSYERNGKKMKPSPRTVKRERELNNEKSSTFNRNRFTEDLREEREVLSSENNFSERYYHRETFTEKNSFIPNAEEIPFRSEFRNSRLRCVEERPQPSDVQQEYQSGSRDNFNQETYARRSRSEANYSQEREFSDGQFYSRREFYRRNKFSHDHDHFSSSRFIERRQESQFYPQDNFCADTVSAYPPVSLLPDPMYNPDGEFDQTYGNMETDSFSPPSSDLCPPPPPPLIRSSPSDRERRDEYCPSPPRIGRCSPEDRDFEDYRSFHRNYEKEQRNFRGRGHFSQDSSNFGHRNNTQGRRGNGRDRWNDDSPPRKRFISDYAHERDDERPRWRRSPSWSPDRERVRRWSRERSLSPPLPEAQPWDSPPPPNRSPPRWHDNYRDRNYRNENYQRYY